MRIRTKANAIAGVFLVAVTALLAVDIGGRLLIRETRHQEKVSHDVGAAVLDLNVLVGEMQIRHNERIKQQFANRISSLQGLLLALKDGPADQQLLVRRMVRSLKNMESAYNKLAGEWAMQKTNLVGASRSQRALRRSFLTSSHSLASLSNRLSQLQILQIERIEDSAHYTSLAALMALVLLLLAIYAMVLFGVLRPLSNLGDRIRTMVTDPKVQAGDDIPSKNELEEISNEFDKRIELVRQAEEELRSQTESLQMEVRSRRRTESALETANRELRRSNLELEQFASAASHDLHEPARKMKTFAGFLIERYSDLLDEKGIDFLRRIQEASVRMQTLINDLLALSRVSSAEQTYEPVDLNEVVQDVLADLELKISESGASIAIESLPTVVANEPQMRQLFQNLIGNAVKYKKPDVAPNIRVTARLSRGPDASGDLVSVWRIEVADSGIGFEPVYAERIFIAFQRLHGHQDYEGSGVGLAVCQRICNRYGGSISATSELDQGSTFTIIWPAAVNEGLAGKESAVLPLAELSGCQADHPSARS